MSMINVVLYHPEIPQNTGNIMRSCVGFNADLHLIEPLGFRIDEKQLKRSARNGHHIRLSPQDSCIVLWTWASPKKEHSKSIVKQ